MSCSARCVERKTPPCWEETVWPHLDGKYSSPALLVKQLLMNGCSPFLASLIERPGGNDTSQQSRRPPRVLHHHTRIISGHYGGFTSPLPLGGRSQQQHRLGHHLKEMKFASWGEQAPGFPLGLGAYSSSVSPSYCWGQSLEQSREA